MSELSLSREALMAALGKALARESELRGVLGLVGSESIVEAVQALVAERDALRKKDALRDKMAYVRLVEDAAPRVVAQVLAEHYEEMGRKARTR